MIKQTFDHNQFIEICDKLKEVKECKLKANTLYAYMLDDKTFTYISEEKGVMNGCIVLKSFKDNEGKKALLMLFIWINASYPKLLETFVKLADKKAKELGAKKIYFIATGKKK